MNSSAARGVALLLIALAFAVQVSSMRRMSETYDEGVHLRFGESLLGKGEVSAFNQSMPVSALNALARAVARHLGLRLSPRAELFVARLPTVCLSLMLAALVFRWSSGLYGPLGGVLSLILYVFDPNLIAHSRVVSTDLPCALFMLLSVYLFVRYLKSRSILHLVVAALATGLAQLTKQTALLLLPLFGVLAVYARIFGPKTPSRASSKSAAHALLFAAVVLLVLNAGYGFRSSWTTGKSLPIVVLPSPGSGYQTVVRTAPNLPIPLPNAYVEGMIIGSYYNATGMGHGYNYLLGRRSQLGWWYYFPVALGLKTPLGLFVLLALAACLLKRSLARNPLDEVAMMLGAAAVFLSFTFFCTAQLGIRYLLPMFPFLHVFAGKLGSVFAPGRRGGFQLVTAGAVGWYVVSSLSYYPQYLSYFNEVIGDRRNMYKYLADSNVDWGQNEYVLARYLASRPREEIAVNPDRPVAGTVIVNVNQLVGLEDPLKYAWLRDAYEPADQVGYSWLVYHVPRPPKGPAAAPPPP